MLLRILVVSFVGYFSNACFAQALPIYSYHIDPPFHVDNARDDLSQHWVKHFNEFQQDTKLSLVTIDRPALNALIEAGKPYLILWANPIWFASRDAKIKASEPIFWDADIWISRSESKLHYTGPEDLFGLTMGGRQGYFYKGVNEWVEQGKIVSHDALSDAANLARLRNGKLDVFVMSRSSFLYWQAQNVMDTRALYVAQSAHDAYTRHVLVSPHHHQLLPLLNRFIDSLAHNPNWQSDLVRWGVKDLTNPFDLELDELDGLKLSAPTEPNPADD